MTQVFEGGLPNTRRNRRMVRSKVKHMIKPTQAVIRPLCAAVSDREESAFQCPRNHELGTIIKAAPILGGSW